MPQAKKLVWQSKTFWFGALTAIFGVVQFFFEVPADTLLKVFPVITTVWGLLAIVLRLISKDKIILID